MKRVSSVRQVLGDVLSILDRFKKRKELKIDCVNCEKHKTMECPNSFYCYSTEDKPYFRLKH